MKSRKNNPPQTRKKIIGYDYMGQRIRFYTVFNYSGNGYWDLKCRKCQKHITVFYQEIWNVPPCECNIEEVKDKRFETFLTSIYRSYKYGADSRGFSFRLTREHVKNFISHKCHYCGRMDSNCYVHSDGTKFYYNGIDRVDSSVGYILYNCVPCCCHCNIMKMALSVNDFLKYIENIYFYQVSNCGTDFCI